MNYVELLVLEVIPKYKISQACLKYSKKKMKELKTKRITYTIQIEYKIVRK